MSVYTCDLQNLTIMVEKLRLAKQTNDLTQIAELKKAIQKYQKTCGSPYSDEEINEMTNTELDNVDFAFLRIAPNLIIRALAEQDLEHAQLLLNGAKAYVKQERTPEGFRAMLESAFQRSPETSDFHAILQKHFPQHPAQYPFKYHEPPEYPQKTNSEIQEEMRKEKNKDVNK